MNTTNEPAGIDLDRNAIRAVFMQHGFTIKEGQADLKPYVYEAAEALIALARRAPAPVLDERALAYAVDHLQKAKQELDQIQARAAGSHAHVDAAGHYQHAVVKLINAALAQQSPAPVVAHDAPASAADAMRMWDSLPDAKSAAAPEAAHADERSIDRLRKNNPEFAAHLERTSAMVETWPKWKQNMYSDAQGNKNEEKHSRTAHQGTAQNEGHDAGAVGAGGGTGAHQHHEHREVQSGADGRDGKQDGGSAGLSDRGQVRAAVACDLPPEGWYCTRTPGHSGPCAAHPMGVQPDRGAAQPVDWTECERVADLPDVDEALRGFSEDPTADNGTMVVRAVLEAIAPSPASQPVAPTTVPDHSERGAANAGGLPVDLIHDFRDAINIAHHRADHAGDTTRMKRWKEVSRRLEAYVRTINAPTTIAAGQEAANAKDAARPIPDAECAQGSCARGKDGCRGRCCLAGHKLPIVADIDSAAMAAVGAAAGQEGGDK